MPNPPSLPTDPSADARGSGPSAGASGTTGTASGPTGATSAPGVAPHAEPDAPAHVASALHPADLEEAALTDEDIATYRRRVAEGFYNSREVAAEVARRMLRGRDI